MRRIFAIDVERRRGLEWSQATSDWEILGLDAEILSAGQPDATLAAVATCASAQQLLDQMSR